MKRSFPRRGKAAAAVAAGVGAIALAGALPAAAGAGAPPRAALSAVAPDQAAVVVGCQHHGEVHPREFILTCADANDYLTGLHWASWRAVAYGGGTEHINTCTPTCASGHFRSYRVLIALWRARRLGRHDSQLHFTRLTEIYTGTRPAVFTARGRKHHPQTVTWHL